MVVYEIHENLEQRVYVVIMNYFSLLDKYMSISANASAEQFKCHFLILRLCAVEFIQLKWHY